MSVTFSYTNWSNLTGNLEAARNKKGEIKRNIYDIELKNNQEVRDNFRITWTAKFVNAYPTALSTINFGSDMRDTMTEYTVELNYDMYTIEFND